MPSSAASRLYRKAVILMVRFPSRAISSSWSQPLRLPAAFATYTFILALRLFEPAHMRTRRVASQPRMPGGAVAPADPPTESQPESLRRKHESRIHALSYRHRRLRLPRRLVRARRRHLERCARTGASRPERLRKARSPRSALRLAHRVRGD
ncbi:hypothetical protein B0H19DRAFT_1070098 [Mycena capillaripes]|nr:hypothetical protein B0H19DRAFT_1070098 [Mycena capillaripes]